MYDPSDIFLGNTELRDLYFENISKNSDSNVCSDYLKNSAGTVDFLYSKNAKADLRMTFLDCNEE